jgi:OFA family oxalate/formate antiporter-like MFS transporter
MNSAKTMNRNLVVVGAIMIQLALGAIYAWSVYTSALVDSGWSKAETMMVFSAGLALFAIVMVVAGRFRRHPKVGPR